VVTEPVALESAHLTTSVANLVGKVKHHKILALSVVLVSAGAVGMTYSFRYRTNFDSPSNSATSISASNNPRASRGTTIEEAYRHYLQGKNLTNQRTAEADKKAIQNFGFAS
jgi:hypothetical protein